MDGTPQEFSHPEITFRFVAAGAAPSIRARVSGQDIDNAIHLAGTVEAVKGVLLTAVPTTPGAERVQLADRRPRRADDGPDVHAGLHRAAERAGRSS